MYNTDIQMIENIRDKVIEFSEGLPGFPTTREFVMTQQPDERPFAWMQSVSDPNLSFAVVDAYAWDKDYSLEIDDHALEDLGSLDPMDYAVYFIVHIQKKETGVTMQAKPNAPVLVNVRNRQARQVVLSPNATSAHAEALCLEL